MILSDPRVVLEFSAFDVFGLLDSNLESGTPLTGGIPENARKVTRTGRRTYAQAFEAICTISVPIASDAVAPGLGAFSTCSASGRAIKRKSCSNSPPA